jgi:hypothetical protein
VTQRAWYYLICETLVLPFATRPQLLYSTCEVMSAGMVTSTQPSHHSIEIYLAIQSVCVFPVVRPELLAKRQLWMAGSKSDCQHDDCFPMPSTPHRPPTLMYESEDIRYRSCIPAAAYFCRNTIRLIKGIPCAGFAKRNSTDVGATS